MLITSTPKKYYIKFFDKNKDEVVVIEADLFFSIFNPHLIVDPEIVPLYDYIYHHFFKPYDYQWHELIIKNLPENLSSKSPFFVDLQCCLSSDKMVRDAQNRQMDFLWNCFHDVAEHFKLCLF